MFLFSFYAYYLGCCCLGLETVSRRRLHTNVSSRKKCSTSWSCLGLGPKGLGVPSRLSGLGPFSSRRDVLCRARHAML